MKIAPIPTVFIGGNHEASNYLWELFHGGFVAHNIYYLGHSGVVNFGGLRIAGMSGIFKDHHYNMGFFERVWMVVAIVEEECDGVVAVVGEGKSYGIEGS